MILFFSQKFCIDKKRSFGNNIPKLRFYISVKFQILFKGYPLFCYFLSCLNSQVSVVPRFKYNACNILLACWISEYKSIFPAILHKPLLFLCFKLSLIQNLIIQCDNINRQTELMFAGSRICNRSLCKLCRFFIAVSLIGVVSHFICKQLFLQLLCSVS